jgi:APA family basic amino acid/polyamine antiporter
MTAYARRLGLFSGTMAVVGGMVGSGIFRSPSVVAQRVHTPASILLVWIIGAVCALCGALCYAELGARKPDAGGSYVYLRDAFGTLPAFLYGWSLLLIIATGAIAGVAVAFAGYAQVLLGFPAAYETPVAVSAIVILSLVNCLGVGHGAFTQNVFTVLKLLALAILIGVGLFKVLPAGAAPALEQAQPAMSMSALVLAVGGALVPVLFSYGGFQQANFVAEEMIDSVRDLPRALALGVLSVVLVYLSANVAYLRCLGPGALAASAAPAADAMRIQLGPLGAQLTAAAVAISTFGCLSLVIMVTPRVYQAIARDGLFFPTLAHLHPVRRTPIRAIALQGVWSIVLTCSGSYGQLVDYVVFADWIFFGLTAASLIVYRRHEARSGIRSSGFRVPGYPYVPFIFVLVASFVVFCSVFENPKNALIGGALIALGIPVHAFFKRSRPVVQAG